MRKFHLIKFLKNMKGNVLLLSLLLLASLLSTVILLSKVVLNEFRMSTNIDNSIFAYYGADSAIEHSLFLQRKAQAKIADLTLSGTLENNVKWDSKTEKTEPSIIGSLQKNKSAQIELYDPEDSKKSSELESMKITWTGPGSWIEVSYVEWSPGAAIAYPDQTVKLQYSGGLAVINAFSSTKAYKVTIKALYAEITDMTIQAYSLDNAAGDLVPITNHLTMVGTGSYGQTRQSIEVIVPQEAPVSGIFDYVIFSEESLVK